MKNAFSQWMSSQLQRVLDADADNIESITCFIDNMDNVDEVVSFVEELIQNCSPAQLKKLGMSRKSFLEQLRDQHRRFACPLPQGDKVVAYSKKDSNPLANTGGKSKKETSKKKTNYVPLYGKDGELHSKAVMLPGRHMCECQAQKHSLINNCLGCGRVVCDQEGSGPCLFCGKLVCTKEEKEILSRKSRKSEKLEQKLMSVSGGATINRMAEALKQAEEYKQRLLRYDRAHKKQTRVIDDESDYYDTNNVWLNHEQRDMVKRKQAEMFEQKYGSRRNKKFTLDFAGRRLVEYQKYEDPTQDRELMEATFGAFHGDDDEDDDGDRVGTLDDLQQFPAVPLQQPTGQKMQVTFVSDGEQVAPTKKSSKSIWNDPAPKVNRLQDDDLLLLCDHGKCLSMHQPWASLLVRGIKIHEGRTWYSSHRGRLWIASTSQKPSEEELKAVVEDHGGDEFRASAYPTSCLLGYVDVDEVLPQDEYRDKFPSGTSASPFVFVCKNPNELMLKVPIKGQHKIWDLDPTVHRAAKKAVML